jgi:hypothetical protein
MKGQRMIIEEKTKKYFAHTGFSAGATSSNTESVPLLAGHYGRGFY